ncbi:putative RNA recognition motif (a k a RRM RBD or RNP domain) [Trypanosoma vivax]|uniref:Putative RNA-binding protein (Rbp39) n=1 Tax=Trypanosoma vivax (strain Y486) TaxID=1055687 RepID=G0U947_TRYVY|nr:hypothetical protein TRVL_05499 [Trypanosoma vivax]KAH8604860.1 putative RNA recognition motif (a k a RRM RBD or RNP domain) [Trypanosoma vivax]CCC54131.1 RBP39 [Trypanosoma vivax Y486]
MSSVQSTSVFFTNVPLFVDGRNLRKHFECVGHVTDFRLMGPAAGKDFRYGFADYMDVASAEEAISRLNGTSFGENIMKVVSAASTRNRKRQRQQSAAPRPAVRGGMVFPRGYVDPLLGRDDISVLECLQGMTVEDAYEAVEQLRVMVLERKNEARKLLENHPAMRLAVVMILQHAGKLPFGPLPPEAFDRGEVKPVEQLPAPKVETVDCKVKEGPSQEERDETIEILTKLSEEEVERIVSMSDADLSRIPDPVQREQLSVLRARLVEMMGELN